MRELFEQLYGRWRTLQVRERIVLVGGGIRRGALRQFSPANRLLLD